MEETEVKDVKEKVEKALNIIEEFKKAHDEALKKGKDKTAEHELKLGQMAEAVAKLVVVEQKYDALAAMSNSAVLKTDNAEEKGLEIEGLFNEYARKSKDRDFLEFLKSKGKDTILKDMSVDSDPDGGFLIIPERIADEKTREFETSPMPALARVQKISTSSVEFIAKNGDRIGATKVSETQARPKTDFFSFFIYSHKAYFLQRFHLTRLFTYICLYSIRRPSKG